VVGQLDMSLPHAAHFLRNLAEGISTWTFADLLKSYTDSLKSHRTIVLVSDETRATESFQKHLSARTLIMPIWFKAEMQSFPNRVF